MNKIDAALLRAFLTHGTDPFDYREMELENRHYYDLLYGKSGDRVLVPILTWAHVSSKQTPVSTLVHFTEQGLERIRNLQDD